MLRRNILNLSILNFVEFKKSFRLLLLFYINVLSYAIFIKSCFVMYEMN